MLAKLQKSMKLLKRANPLRFFLVIVSILVVAIVLVAIVLYATRFSAGFSDRQEIWGAFGDYFGGVLSVVLGFFSLIFALYVLLKTNQYKIFDQIYRFLDEFKSDKMSANLKLLWDFYNYQDYKKCRKPFPGGDPEKKKTLMKRYVLQHRGRSSIYLARRGVSYFYLYLAIFLKNNEIDEKSILALWPASSLDTLQVIIMPCEQAITKEGSIPDKFVHFEYLIERWKEFESERH